MYVIAEENTLANDKATLQRDQVAIWSIKARVPKMIISDERIFSLESLYVHPFPFTNTECCRSKRSTTSINNKGGRTGKKKSRMRAERKRTEKY
jgi:hypothetical protein